MIITTTNATMLFLPSRVDQGVARQASREGSWAPWEAASKVTPDRLQRHRKRPRTTRIDSRFGVLIKQVLKRRGWFSLVHCIVS